MNNPQSIISLINGIESTSSFCASLRFKVSLLLIEAFSVNTPHSCNLNIKRIVVFPFFSSSLTMHSVPNKSLLIKRMNFWNWNMTQTNYTYNFVTKKTSRY